MGDQIGIDSARWRIMAEIKQIVDKEYRLTLLLAEKLYRGIQSEGGF